MQVSHASWKILESPGIFVGKSPGPGKFWKMILVLESLGNLLATSWKLLGNDADGSFWLQIDVFLQTKIAITVATRFTFWPAGVQVRKMQLQLGLCPGPCWRSLQRSPRPISW